jgi:hypothetical protein
MSGLTTFDLDDTGKIDLHAIYDQPDPRDYFQTLDSLDYQIPAVAAPVFRKVIDARRRLRKRRQATLLDVGSSYGVNAAILRNGIDLTDLFRLYSRSATKGLSRSQLVARDRKLYCETCADKDLTAIGLDIAGEAVGYAEEVGIIDAGLAANLEQRPPTADEGKAIAPVDLVISTGAIGYVGAPTFARILDRAGKSPWFALFALRMFPLDDIAATLRKHGYSVYRLLGRTFRQRRFASREEARQVITRLEALGIDPAGHESDGWYHADFYFARREEEEGPPPLQGLAPA